MKTYLEIIIILYILPFGESGIFSSSIDKLKNKAKQIYRKKFGKDKAVNFWGHELSEYPGANKKYQDQNTAKWNEYYSCLRAQAENLGNSKALSPEAILGFESSYVKLDCKICISPLESQSKESIDWEFAPIGYEVTSPIEFTEHILVSPEDRSLQIYNLKIENSGQYFCRLGDVATAPYFLTVVNISESAMDEVHSPTAPVGPYPKESEDIDYNLVLDTEWGEWSACSNCDNVGKRYKLGYCNIYAKSYVEKENGTQQSTEELFNIFKYGIPCQSHLLPESLKNNAKIVNRKNEIMTGYCNVKCPENTVFVVRDKHGNILETANNSAGIYALSQGLPPIEPPTERRVQYEIKGKDLILECPGNINSDAPLQWQIGDKNIIPEIISKESNGRIYISVSDKIHIKKAKISDSNIYSCWQLKELAGTIRLVIEKKMELNFNHTVMLFGILIIMGTFLYVIVKVIATRELTKNIE